MLKQTYPDWGCERISHMLLREPALPASPNAVARVLRQRMRRAGDQSPHEPFHAVVAAREVVLGAEILPDPLRCQPLVKFGRDHRAIRLALLGPAARSRPNFAPDPVGIMAAFEFAGESAPPSPSVASGARAGKGEMVAVCGPAEAVGAIWLLLNSANAVVGIATPFRDRSPNRGDRQSVAATSGVSAQ